MPGPMVIATSPAPASAVRPLLLMLAAMASFVANDTLVKTVIDDLPVGEIIAVRGAMAAGFIALIALASGQTANLRQVARPIVMVRAVLDSTATLLFLVALGFMQIANLTAVMQAVPLVVTLIGMLFLGEPVGWRRLTAISVGFLGVLLVVKPAATPLVYEVCALGVVVTVALRDLATKRIPSSVPSILVALVNAVFVGTMGAIVLLFQHVVPLSLDQFIRLAGAALCLASGYICMVATLRTARLSTTAPARYSIIVFAILSGIVVFDQFPDRWALLGIALIVTSGLYAIHRERIRMVKPVTPN
jgi:drug/metabolite transporter (DMT)-like permease